MTQSPFNKSGGLNKRLKLLLYGDVGSGKTQLALHFPKPVIIDMERGADLYSEKFDYSVIRTSDPDEIMEAVKWLHTNKHTHKTLILDPITVYWEAIQQKWEDIFLQRNPGSKFNKVDYWDRQPGDWSIMKSEFNQLLRICAKLDMNVIATAGVKALYSEGSFMKKVGDTFDGPKQLPRFFDTVVRLHKRDGKYYGDCTGDTLKDRTGKMPKDLFEMTDNPFAVFRTVFGDALDRDCTPAKIVTPDQKVKIEHLCVDLSVSKERFATALRKYETNTVEDLTTQEAAEIIDKMQTKLDALKKEAA